MGTPEPHCVRSHGAEAPARRLRHTRRAVPGLAWLTGLGLLLVLTAPLQAVEVTGHVRAGMEQVNLDRFRLGFDSFGDLKNQAVNERGLQSRYAGSVTMYQEADLGGAWILDAEGRFDFDVTSALQITSERYDRASAWGRTTFARELPHDSMLAFELKAQRYVEQFLPDLEGTMGGADLVYERQFGGDAFVKARLGIERGTLTNSPGDDFTETRFELQYQHLPPEQVHTEVLPFHPKESVPNEWEFLFSHAMNLDKARELIRFQGDAPMIADMAPEPPLPTAWRAGLVRPRVGIRESIFSAGLEGIRRDLASGNSYTRGAAHAGIEWSLSDFLALAVSDTVAAQDWARVDAARLRSDRLQNNLTFNLAYSKERTYVTLEAGLDSHFLDDLERLDYNRPRLGIYGSYDPGGKYRMTGFVRAAREINLDEQGDFPDLTRWDSFAGLTWRFRPGSRMELSYLRERVNITGLQSEFDSAYLDQTFRVSYRQQLLKKMYAEGGYVLKDETNEFFKENDRTDGSAFLNLGLFF